MDIKKINMGRKITLYLSILAIGFTMLAPANVSAICKTKQVKSLKVTVRDYHSVNLKWKRVKSAKGYQIYRSKSKSDKYKKIKTIKNGKKVIWTDKKIKTGKKYYYKVRAYKINSGKRIYGKFSRERSVKTKLLKPVITKYVASENHVTLKWKKVKGATGYQIYQSKKKTGTYRKLYDTKSAAVKIDALEYNSTYYYKVRAYRKSEGKRVYSGFSSVKSIQTAKLVLPELELVEDISDSIRYEEDVSDPYDNNGEGEDNCDASPTQNES